MLGKKKLMAGLVPVGLISALAMMTMALVPTSAAAYEYQHVYCSQYLAVNGTCPPNGSSEYAHLELNNGDAGGQSHETCVDDYFVNIGYTNSACMYYAGEVASIISEGQYGYPRAWNGGKIEHFVYAEEYGHHTSSAGPEASVGVSDLPRPLAALSQVEPSLDPAASVLAAGEYPTWVIPGSKAVCIVDAMTGPGGSRVGVCGPTSAAETRGLALVTESAAGSPIVIGLAPAGNTSVEVTNTDGTTDTVPVADHVYEITSGNPSTVRLKEASGEETTRHVPALSLPPA